MNAVLAADPVLTAPVNPARGVLRTFGAVLWRDIFVTGREIGSFLAQVLLQPFLTLLIFGWVLGNLGYVGPGFIDVLLPGIVAQTAFLVALQNTMLPMVVEFSWTREIEDRLLAPMPVQLLAIEKIVFGALRGTVAAVLMVPVGFLVLNGVSWPGDVLAPMLLVVVLGSLLGAAIGMTVGTLVPPARINVMFTVLLLPMMFTGSVQFPWLSLGKLGWFQVVCAVNPLTYVSEGVRAVALGARIPSIPLYVDVPAIGVCCVVFALIGMAGFLRRSRF